MQHKKEFSPSISKWATYEGYPMKHKDNAYTDAEIVALQVSVAYGTGNSKVKTRRSLPKSVGTAWINIVLHCLRAFRPAARLLSRWVSEPNAAA